MFTRCDKCKGEVHPSNDATIVDAIAHSSPLTIFFAQSRHFLPVHDAEGKMICEGSPSRAQYIEGQPRDTRGYPYLPEREIQYRAAYAQALTENGNRQATTTPELPWDQEPDGVAAFDKMPDREKHRQGLC